MKTPQIGIYYYPWYCAMRWSHHERHKTPVVGEYDSSSTELIKYHVKLLSSLGIDYVVIEMPSMDDWNFEFIYSNSKILISELQKYNIKFTFLIDLATAQGQRDEPDFFANGKPCLDSLKLLDKLMQDKIIPTKFKNDKPLILFFSTYVPECIVLRDRLMEDYSIFFVTFMADWDYACWYWNSVMRGRGYNCPPSTPRRISLVEGGFFQFWANTKDIFSAHGFVPVVPGYDDRLLGRNSQELTLVDRKNGLALVEQFKKALSFDPDDIIIYSFNEFFEDTAIEPTLEEGDFYYKLTKDIIAKIKSHETFSIDNDKQPCATKPLYLTEELKRITLAHADPYPRWDSYDFRFSICKIGDLQVNDGMIYIPSIHCINSGLKPWHIQSEGMPIMLGAQLCDEKGIVISEGRASLGDADVVPSMQVVCDLVVTFPTESTPKKIFLGVLWEGEFWFENKLVLEL